MVPAIEYLEWVDRREGRATHDLGTSDLRWNGDDPLSPPLLGPATEPSPDRSLRELVADGYGHGVTPEQVLVTAGASHANFAVVAAALGESRRTVLVERPGYEPLRRTPALLGGSVDRFDRPPGRAFAVDGGSLATALGPDTALVSVTNRHNPSGRRLDRSALSALTRRVRDAGARLLVDEVYAPFARESAGGGVFGGPTAAGLPGTVVTDSVTKFPGLAGLRVGWVVAEESFVERARTAALHVPVVSDPARALARRAVASRESLSRLARERVAANAGLLRSFVAGRDDLSGRVFDGSTFAFLRHDCGDGDRVSDRAWAEGILVTPGSFFDDRSRVRVSLAGTPDAMADALAAFGCVLDDL